MYTHRAILIRIRSNIPSHETSIVTLTLEVDVWEVAKFSTSKNERQINASCKMSCPGITISPCSNKYCSQFTMTKLQ